MTARDDRLGQFFGCYFHQDWDVDGATCWQDVVALYARQMPREHLAVLVDDLRSWAADAKLVGQTNLPPAFGCDYNPRVDGLTERDWVLELADEAERLLAN